VLARLRTEFGTLDAIGVERGPREAELAFQLVLDGRDRGDGAALGGGERRHVVGETRHEHAAGIVLDRGEEV
jgi:hypothetical protein